MGRTFFNLFAPHWNGASFDDDGKMYFGNPNNEFDPAYAIVWSKTEMALMPKNVDLKPFFQFRANGTQKRTLVTGEFYVATEW